VVKALGGMAGVSDQGGQRLMSFTRRHIAQVCEALLPASPALALPEISSRRGSVRWGPRLLLVVPDLSPSWGLRSWSLFGEVEITGSSVAIADNGTFSVEFSAPDKLQVGTPYVPVIT